MEENTRKEYLIISRTYYSFDDNGTPHEKDASEEIAQVHLADIKIYDVGAPGYGKIHFRVTRIDGEGVWGVKVKDRSGFFAPEDVK